MARKADQFRAEFPSTHWSQVARAADADPQAKRLALNQLLLQYLPAFKSHLLSHWRLSSAEADELLQGFACDRIVAEDLLAQAERQRGRLRTFLLTALDCQVLRVRRYQQAEKRRPEHPVRSLDTLNASPVAPPAGDAFDLAWARQVIGRALETMRQHCQASGREQVWELFRCRVLVPIFEHQPAVPYEQLIQRFGLSSPTQAFNLLASGKRMFARLLRSIIAEYAADEGEIIAELNDLWSIFAHSVTRAGELPEFSWMAQDSAHQRRS